MVQYDNYLYGIDTVLSITHNLEVVYSVQEGVRRLHALATPCCIGRLGIRRADRADSVSESWLHF